MNCSHRPRHQVNQIVTVNKPEFSLIEQSGNKLDSVALVNRLEVLNQLDEKFSPNWSHLVGQLEIVLAKS